MGDVQNGKSTSGNYTYDEIGQLIGDAQENIILIKWTVTNKVKEVQIDTNNDPLTTEKTIRFDYDAMGNRIAKHVTEPSGTKSTFYTLDAQGNIMSVYEFDDTNEILYLSERNIYGSSRLGQEVKHKQMSENMYTYTGLLNSEIGDKRYELSNHLGNVLEVVTDRKLVGTTDELVIDVVEFKDEFNTSSTLGWYYEPSVHSGSPSAPLGYSLTTNSGKLVFSSGSAVSNATKQYFLEAGVEYTLNFDLVGISSGTLTYYMEDLYGMLDSDVASSAGSYSMRNGGGGEIVRIVFISSVSNAIITLDNIELVKHVETEIDESYTADVIQYSDYYPYGMLLPNRHGASNQNYRYGYQGSEQDNEIKGEGNSYTTENRFLDVRIGKWLSIDALSSKNPGMSPYVSMNNNPITTNDVLGLEGNDFVKGKSGAIRWDKNVTSSSDKDLKEGDKYLGTTLTFKFTSYIDKNLWDGPLGSLPTGTKLTSTIKVNTKQNDKGELTDVSATFRTETGETPTTGLPIPGAEARLYYPGEGGSVRTRDASQTKNSKGIVQSFDLGFEQHACVSKTEESGLRVMGFLVVDVAQKLKVKYENGTLSIASYTDVFPSATLRLNGSQIMKYNQPSFLDTHSAPYKFQLLAPYYVPDFSYYKSKFYKR